MIDYARSFILLGQLDQADAVAATVQQGLQRVRANQSMKDAKIGVYGHRLNSLRNDLERLREEQR